MLHKCNWRFWNKGETELDSNNACLRVGWDHQVISLTLLHSGSKIILLFRKKGLKESTKN